MSNGHAKIKGFTMRGVICGVKSVETGVKSAGVAGGMKSTAPAARLKSPLSHGGRGAPGASRAGVSTLNPLREHKSLSSRERS